MHHLDSKIIQPTWIRTQAKCIWSSTPCPLHYPVDPTTIPKYGVSFKLPCLHTRLFLSRCGTLLQKRIQQCTDSNTGPPALQHQAWPKALPTTPQNRLPTPLLSAPFQLMFLSRSARTTTSMLSYDPPSYSLHCLQGARKQFGMRMHL